jgi:RNA polymerase sigma factor (sigma-70 family)
MNIVEHLLQETVASGDLERQLRIQYARWHRLWDFEEFRAEVLESAWVHQSQFRGQTAPEFLAWLRRLAWSAGVDRWRQRQRQATLLERFVALLPSLPAPSAQPIETKDFVEWLLAGLTDRERNLLIMKYYRQMLPSAMARELETSQEGVRQLHHRAIAKLRKRLNNRD